MNACPMLLVLSATSVSSLWNLQKDATTPEDLVAAALTSIIENVYVQRSPNIFVASNETDVRHNAILRLLFGALDVNTPYTCILHDMEYLNGNIERFSNVVLIDSSESLGSIFESVTNTSLETFGFYTVVITNFNEPSDLNSNLIDIFSAFWHRMILDVNILTYCHENASLLLHTYFPFAANHCNKIEPVIINAFKNGRFFETDVKLFPLKTRNLFQCPIPVLVAPIRPYIYVTRNHSDGSHDFEGFEYNVVNELARQINFQPNITVFWNDDISIVFGILGARDYEMLVGGFVFTPNVDTFMGSTKGYSSDNIVIVVPNPRPYSSFETLFFPFTLTMWISLSMTIAVAVIVITSLQRYGKEYYELLVGSKNRNPHFSLMRALLTGSVTYTSNGSFARFVLIVWLMTCLVLQNVYQGQLFNFMKTNATVASVKTTEELIDRNVSIKLIWASYIDYFLYDYDRYKKMLIFVNDSTDYFVTEREAYVTMEIELIDEVRQSKPETQPKIIKLVLAPHVIDLPKRYYLKHAMDDVISYMTENGLISKWTAPYKESAIADNGQNSTPRKLIISQIFGVVQVCCGMLILSMLVFVFELLCDILKSKY